MRGRTIKTEHKPLVFYKFPLHLPSKKKDIVFAQLYETIQRIYIIYEYMLRDAYLSLLLWQR